MSPHLEKYRSLLHSKTRDELNVIGKRLNIPDFRKLNKVSLIEALLQIDHHKLSSLLIPSWWTRYHNHVYGAIGIFGVALTILFYQWQKVPTPSFPVQLNEETRQIKDENSNVQLTINPAEFLALIKEKQLELPWNKEQTNQEIFEFVDGAADDADRLATIWSNLVEELVDVRLNSAPSKNQSFLEKYQYLPEQNSSPFGRLESFYIVFTRITQGKQLRWHWSQNFTNALNVVITSRKITKQRFEDYLASSENTFLDQRNSLDDLKDLSRSVEVLQREAAALHVLAKAIKLEEAERSNNLNAGASNLSSPTSRQNHK